MIGELLDLYFWHLFFDRFGSAIIKNPIRSYTNKNFVQHFPNTRETILIFTIVFECFYTCCAIKGFPASIASAYLYA